MNHSTSLEPALNRYKDALNLLDVPNISLNKKQILDVLVARDALQKKLESEANIPIEILSKLVEQDNKLKKNAYKITNFFDLEDYRNTLSITNQAWWWYLDSRESQHPFNRFDWIFKTMKLLFLGVNLTLIITISTRFLAGGSGWQEMAFVIFSTLISLLETQDALSQARQKLFVKLMKLFDIQEHWYEEIQCLITVIIFLLLLIISLNFPLFSEFYKQQGDALQFPNDSQQLPNLASAEAKYLKAIEFNPDNLDAHYKLAILYEDLQQLHQAKRHYLIAAKGGSLDAYNNLSYLYIQDNQASRAVKLLENAKALLAEKDNNLEQLTDKEKLDLQVQKYSIYKNLGWARLKQNRNEDTMINLLIAKSIAENKEYQDYIRNPGAVFCLSAQLLQKQNNNQQNISVEVKETWRNCFDLSQGKELTIEEEQWLYEAQKNLALE